MMLGTNRDNELCQQIIAEFQASIEVKQRILDEQVPVLSEIVQLLTRTLRGGGKILIFGNGGSAADSQHIAAEFVSRFRRERKALAAIALTTDTSILTSIANDYSYQEVFARQVEAWGDVGDVAIGISTSGTSPNVVKGLAQAKSMGMSTVALTGESGGTLLDRADVCFRVPSMDTARIQESHITAAHTICDLVEQEFTEGDEQS